MSTPTWVLIVVIVKSLSFDDSFNNWSERCAEMTEDRMLLLASPQHPDLAGPENMRRRISLFESSGE